MSTALTVYKRKRKNERKNEMRSAVVSHFVEKEEEVPVKKTLLQRLINFSWRTKQ